MKNLLPLLSMLLMLSCQSKTNSFRYESEEEWKLAFRVLESEVLQNYELGSQQLDSLLAIRKEIEPGILNSGLKCLARLNQHEKLFSILEGSSSESKNRVGKEEWFLQLPDSERKRAIRAQLSLEEEKFTHPQLREQLLIMYMNDQYVRGGVAEELQQTLQMEVEGNLYDKASTETDAINREKLKEMIEAFGFPTKEMVGELGMMSVFLVIQHADMDTAYQRSQLVNLEKAAQRGDVKPQQYAYLYDRIMVNAGKEQRYGSQFSSIDRAAGEAILAAVQDEGNLNRRRREMGMMPVETYKKLILSAGGAAPEKSDKERRMKSVQNGLQAPKGDLLDMHGRIVSMDDFRGELLVIDFWASWCSPCLRQTSRFMELAQQYKDERVNFITVSIDDQASYWKEYVQEKNWTGNNYWLGSREDNPLFSFLYSEIEAAPGSSKTILIALPKYVFISAEGKIVNNNAPHPTSAEFENKLKQYLGEAKATTGPIL